LNEITRSARAPLKRLLVLGLGLLLQTSALLAANLGTTKEGANIGTVNPRATELEIDIQELAKPAMGSNGSIGVAAWRLDGSGPKALVNAQTTFPMASTFKVAVVGAVLKMVDDGKINLDEMIKIDSSRMVDSEVIADRFIHPGISLSVYNLLELMLTQSDNTATDYMVEAAGGASAVTAWVRNQGISGLRIDGDTAEIIRRFFGLGAGPLSPALAARRAFDEDMDRKGDSPNPAFNEDPRDTSTPEAMAQLLTRIFDGRALSADSTMIITQMMSRCRTGNARLRGRMAADSTVADKTGTIGGTVNDVGVISLPRDHGQVVVAVFIKKSDAPDVAREKAIAEIGRSVRDYYLYRAPP
jgi:beta-lactamase class A